MKLGNKNLPKISQHISTPTYHRSEVSTGIVHIGVGGFHRSHQAYYIHQLLQKGQAKQWGICGMGLQDGDRRMNDVLMRQDGLYTLIVQHPDGTEEIEVIGSILEYILAFEDHQLAIDRMAAESTHIVSLTITEGGYNFNSTTGAFDFDNPDILHELKHPDDPRTVYGFLTAALKKRKSNGLRPFTVLSCDNIQHNGDVARKMLLTFARKQDSELATWIDREVSFPNSMVDRITPATTPQITRHLQTKYQIYDEWGVVCEPFLQWVVEDNFSDGRPPLEEVGVQFVPDVTPYEKMKIRLLNAGHSVLGIPGAIYGHTTIDACMGDQVFSEFLRRFMDEEVTPQLEPVEGVDLNLYKDSLERRFANSNIKDSVGRICSESSAKLPKFLIPTLEDNLMRGGSIKYATFIIAAWCYYSDKGLNEQGDAIEIIDAQQTALNRAARRSQSDWKSFLLQEEIFGNIAEIPRFTAEYIKAVQSIYRETAIRRLMKDLL